MGADALFALEDVSVHRGGKTVLDGVSIAFDEGATPRISRSESSSA